jgi:dynactin complex subunit
MEPFEKLKDRLNDALGQIESSLQNSENDNSLENLISENSALERQIDLLKIELENLNKNGRQPVEPLETVELEDLRAELAKMKEEREEEKKELQSLYDQLSSALAGSGETV